MISSKHVSLPNHKVPRSVLCSTLLLPRLSILGRLENKVDVVEITVQEFSEKN
jgi:hypothetical protein